MRQRLYCLSTGGKLDGMAYFQGAMIPDEDGSSQTDDHGSIFQQIDGNKVLVTLAEIL